MFRGSWRDLAFACGLVFLSLSGHAQEHEQQPKGTEADEKPTLPPMVRVEIIEQKPDAESAKAAAQKAEERDDRDLLAQEGMYFEAKRMADYAVAQTILGAIGAALVLASLYLAIQANRSSVQALHAQRAWVLFDHYDQLLISGGVNQFVDLPEGQPRRFTKGLGIIPKFKNFGSSPAMQVEIFCDHKVVESGSAIPTFERTPPAEGAIKAPLAQGSLYKAIERVVVDDELAAIKSRQKDFYVYTHVSYRDIYQPKLERITEVCAKIEYSGQIERDGRRGDNFNFYHCGQQNRTA